MKRVIAIARWSMVSVGILVLTSFTIDATDTLRGSATALSGFANTFTQTGCPAGMSELRLAEGRYCIDTYENSVGPNCPQQSPQTELASKENLETPECDAVSAASEIPWTAITFHQAKALCAKRGMRLPTAVEWQEAALGTPSDTRCNIENALDKTGSYNDCVSFRGTYDMVGNVWEWIDAQVAQGKYEGRVLPMSGYVTAAAADGIARTTAGAADERYDAAYFWQTASGTQVMMRGGYYDSREDASIYTTHAGIEADFQSPAIGWRCIVEVS